MMSLIAEQNLKEDKAYGQECKEIIMCLPRRPRASAPPPPTVEEKEAEMEVEAQKEEEKQVRVDNREAVLEENILRQKRGRGRRSLLTGSSGGIGFFNRYMNR